MTARQSTETAYHPICDTSILYIHIHVHIYPNNIAHDLSKATPFNDLSCPQSSCWQSPSNLSKSKKGLKTGCHHNKACPPPPRHKSSHGPASFDHRLAASVCQGEPVTKALPLGTAKHIFAKHAENGFPQIPTKSLTFSGSNGNPTTSPTKHPKT